MYTYLQAGWPLLVKSPGFDALLDASTSQKSQKLLKCVAISRIWWFPKIGVCIYIYIYTHTIYIYIPKLSI